MILELKRDKTRKGAAYKCLAEEVHGGGIVVRDLIAEVNLKNLDEITDAEELVIPSNQKFRFP